MKVSRWLWLGLTLMSLAAFWHVGMSPYWRQRFPVGWQQEYYFIGVNTLPDPLTGQFPLTDDTGIYRRIFTVLALTPDAVTLQDQYVIRDSLTDEITYNYTYRATVDPRTAMHLARQYQGEYYLFPREVEKRSYTIRHSYVKGVTVDFQREEMVEGVKTYLFTYHGPAEYTEAYVGMQDALGRELGPGHEMRCADDQFRYALWVEPITGEILKIDESCYAGDYVYNIATNQPVFPALRWGAVTAGDDVQARSDAVRQNRLNYLWAVYFLPLLLLGAGAFSFATYFYLRQRAPHRVSASSNRQVATHA